MTNQQVAINQRQKPLERYRGVLVYRQEYGYKLITMLIDLRTPDEQSSVLRRLGDLDLVEETEHIPASLPLAAVEGTEIELTLKSQMGKQTARYIIDVTSVQEQSSLLWLDILALSESRHLPVQNSVEHYAGGTYEAIY